MRKPVPWVTGLLPRRCLVSARGNFLIHGRHLSTRATELDPLRILFCGTDAFSAGSLSALHEYSQDEQSNILSIDVVTKTTKRTGRRNKLLKPPFIKGVADDLGLPVHQIDTFTGWSPPEYGKAKNPYINLVIAVSFGLLIPQRILKLATYGGLNVHPSMLPEFRGPAPIQWTIMTGRSRTGVTLQTLHPTRFDQGVILDQSPPPGLTISNPDEINTVKLTELLAPVGADMLVNAIRNRLYVPPYDPVRPHSPDPGSRVTYAHKITTDMCLADFQGLTSAEILRRNRAISPLYGLTSFEAESGRLSRIVFGTDVRASTPEDVPEELKATVETVPPGVPYAIIKVGENIAESSGPLLVNAKSIDGQQPDLPVAIPTITVSSMRKGPGAGAAARAKFFAPNPVVVGDHQVYQFSHPLSPRTQAVSGTPDASSTAT